MNNNKPKREVIGESKVIHGAKKVAGKRPKLGRNVKYPHTIPQIVRTFSII